MIYVKLQGRIGNQLFMYAMARHMQMERGKAEEIVIDDSLVKQLNWIDSLEDYELKNVSFVSDGSLNTWKEFALQKLCHAFYYKKVRPLDFWPKYHKEKKLKSFFAKCGYVACENGYMNIDVPKTKNVVLNGYFQSERYFLKNKDIIRDDLSLDKAEELRNYPGIDQLETRNSVCISIKIEHNVGSSIYDVCGRKYWEDAIQYIIEHVDNPLFFICSDNVEYVKSHLIDCEKYDVVCQDKTAPVHISLAAMSKCKHFIIGNTTFGWWAQYLCENDNKIVIAPDKWMLVDMPIDIYDDAWTLLPGRNEEE